MARALTSLLFCGLLMVGCAALPATPAPTPTTAPTASPSHPPPSITPAPPTPTPAPVRVWIDPAVPIAVRDQVAKALSKIETMPARSATESDLRIGLNLAVPLAQWVYALVVPFPTLADGIGWDDLERFWAGDVTALGAISEDAVPPTLFLSPETLGALHGLLGPASGESRVSIAEPDELLDLAWEARPHAFAALPFEELQPRWKVLQVDGASVLDRALVPDEYPLALAIGAEGGEADTIAASLRDAGAPLTNRQEDEITTLVMTGVTALVRGIAHRMEEKGVLYPAENIGPVLREADVLHISNEVSFASECPPADPNSESLSFCSAPEFVELLRAVGTNVIELTGNHVKDYGSQPMLDTLEMYCDKGWLYYGGGKDLEDARLPITIRKHGTLFGFIGCNAVGPELAWATADEPGAALCDTEYLRSQLAELKAQTDVPIATVQYWEFYQYEPSQQQRLDFRELVDAGASIVSGSHAHHPQAIEFYHDGFIHYGLGNLFFDQMWSLGTRQQFVDRHVIYRGRHVSTELLTYMLEDYSQPRLMTAGERRELLQAVFEASGW